MVKKLSAAKVGPTAGAAVAAVPSAISIEAVKRILPWLVAVAFFMQALDTTILNTAVPAIAKALAIAPLSMKDVYKRQVSVSSNGLFTTLMDFGPSPFNGSTTNWVEIGVQTNGGSGFTTLTPRQLLTPAPLSLYASTAGMANGVSASTVIQGQSLSIGQSNTVGGAYSTIAGGGNLSLIHI